MIDFQKIYYILKSHLFTLEQPESVFIKFTFSLIITGIFKYFV